MADRNAIYSLAFEVVKSEQQQAIKSIKDLSKELLTLQKQGDHTSDSTAAIAERLQKLANADQVLRQLAEEAKSMGLETDDANASLARAYELLEKIGSTKAEVGALADEMHRTGNEIEQASDEASDFSKRLDIAGERYRNVNNQVDLGGQLETGARTVGGALGGDVGQGLNVVAEIGAVAEALPRLKLGLQNLPDVTRAVVKELGAGGVGLIGALGALAVVTAIAIKAQEDNKLKAEAVTAAMDTYFELLQTGTTAQVLAKKKEIEAEIQLLELREKADQERVDSANKTAEEIKSISPGSVVLEGLVNAVNSAGKEIGAFNSEGKEAEDQLSRTKGELAAARANLEVFNELLDENTLATNDAAAALIESNKLQIKAIEEKAAREKEVEALIAGGSLEAAKDRQAALLLERKSTSDQLAALQAIQNPTEDVINKIQSLGEEQKNIARLYGLIEIAAIPVLTAQEQEVQTLERLTAATNGRVAALLEQSQYELEFNRFLKTASIEGTQARIEGLREERESIMSILPELHRLSTESDEAAAEYQNAVDRLQDIRAQLADLGSEGIAAAIANEQSKLDADITRILTASAEKIGQIRSDLAQKEIDLYSDLQTKLADAIKSAAEKREELERDYVEKSVEIAEDLADKKLEIEKKFARSQEQAIGDRDALALYQAKQTRDDELSDAEKAAKEQQESLNKNYAKQLDTINRELAKQQATLQAQYNAQLNTLRMNAQNAINLENQKAQAEINTRQQAFNMQVQQLQSFATTGTGLIASFATNSITALQGFVSRANQLFSGLGGSSTSSGGGVVVIPDGGAGGGMGGNQQPFASGDLFQPPTTGINFNITGNTRDSIIKQVNSQLYNLLSGLDM